MPLLGRGIFVGLSLSLLLGSGCFEDPPQGDSGATEAADDGSQTGADETSPGPDPTGDPSGGGCAGCLDMAGGCLAGNLDQACGALAAACIACDDDSFCNEGTCELLPACNADNCDGCCDGDDCVPGTELNACGGDGQQCATCSPESSCDAGVCVLPCSSTCDGCCDDSGTCTPLDTTAEAACGVQGEACEQCEENFECVEGVCISSACLMSCAGCCVGDTCMDGQGQDACGVSGAACSVCPSGTVCDSVCTPEAGTLWQVFVESATTAVSPPGGGIWDPLGSPPDPYVIITFGETTAQTDFVDDTTNPIWEALLFEGLTSEELLAGAGVYALWDEDVGAADNMGECMFDLSDDQFGVPLQADCAGADGRLLWSLRFTLVPVE